MGTETQGKTLGKKLEAARTSNMFAPAPGTYEPNYNPVLTASPGWRMGTSTRNDADKARARTSNFPPPDSYNPHFKTIKEGSPTFSFGKGQRSSLGASTFRTPGAGTYNIPSYAVEGRQNSMGLKLEAQSAIGIEQRKTRGNPGAGTYNADFTKVAKHNGAFSMKARPATKVEDKAPGPGAYNQTKVKGKAAPAYGFGSASQREKQPPATAPGPGNYHVPCSISNLPSYTGARPKDLGYI